MKKAFLAGVLFMSMGSCATLKYLFTFEPDYQIINIIWEEIKSELKLNPNLPLPKIIVLSYKDDTAAARYFYGRKEIKIYGFYGDRFFYKTITHELLHYGLDIKWRTSYPPERLDDHAVIPKYIENIRKKIKFI